MFKFPWVYANHIFMGLCKSQFHGSLQITISWVFANHCPVYYHNVEAGCVIPPSWMSRVNPSRNLGCIRLDILDEAIHSDRMDDLIQKSWMTPSRLSCPVECGDHILIDCRLISWTDLAFRMWGTCILTESFPFPANWPCNASRPLPMSADPTWLVCLKFVGWPICDRSIRGLLSAGGGCSWTQDPNSWTQNSPAMLVLLCRAPCPEISSIVDPHLLLRPEVELTRTLIANTSCSDNHFTSRQSTHSSLEYGSLITCSAGKSLKLSAITQRLLNFLIGLR